MRSACKDYDMILLFKVLYMKHNWGKVNDSFYFIFFIYFPSSNINTSSCWSFAFFLLLKRCEILSSVACFHSFYAHIRCMCLFVSPNVCVCVCVYTLYARKAIDESKELLRLFTFTCYTFLFFLFFLSNFFFYYFVHILCNIAFKLVLALLYQHDEMST